MRSPALHEAFIRSAEQNPQQIAVVEPGLGQVSYGDLASLAHRLRDRLHAMGVRPGDRVGIYMRKSIDTVAAIYGILQTGAAYVPVDPGAPVQRNAYILHNCDVRAVVIERRFTAPCTSELGTLGCAPALMPVDSAEGGSGLRRALDRADAENRAPSVSTVVPPAERREPFT